MAKKPLYGKFLTSAEFQTRSEADKFAKTQKSQYKQADISVKHDINRTPSSSWRVTLYAKV